MRPHERHVDQAAPSTVRRDKDQKLRAYHPAARLVPNIDVRGGLQEPLITDSGHYLLDCHLRTIPDPESLGAKLKQIPGVVEHGLFINIATDAVIGHASGHAEVMTFRAS